MQQEKTDAIDVVAWGKQREQFPEDQLKPHWGRQAAFSADGKRIIASAPTRKELYRMLEDQGVDLEQVVVEYINDPGVSYL